MRSAVLRHILGGTIVLALASGVMAELIHAATLSFAARQATSASSRSHDIGTPVVRQRIPYPPGIPAITPSLQVADASQATFTIDDMQRYFAARSIATADGTAPQIIRIGFVTAGEASALLHGEWIGRPATAIVGFVAFAGNFSTAADSPPSSLSGSLPSVVHYAWAVFDARTGNALLGGSGNEAPGS